MVLTLYLTFGPLLVSIAASGNGHSRAQPDLARLQNDFAVRDFEPEPHMALTARVGSRVPREASDAAKTIGKRQKEEDRTVESHQNTTARRVHWTSAQS